MKGKATKSKAKSKRPAGKKGGKKRSKSNISDYASASVKTTLTPPGGGNFASNLMYNQINVQLAQFDRAVTIAKAYQFYKIKSVKLTYLFPYDTFAAVPGATSRPNFYYMFDKSGSIAPAATLAQLKQMGARPKAVDNRPVTITWQPSVLTEEETLAGAVAAQYKLSPWLSTNAQTIQHRGVYWFIEQLFAGGTQYEVEMEVQFQFMKPLWTGSEGATPAIGAVPAILDNSPDGIVGGPDSNNNPSFIGA